MPLFSWSVERSDSSNALMLPELLRRIEEGRGNGELRRTERWFRFLDRLFRRVPKEPVALKVGTIHQCAQCNSFVPQKGDICFRCQDKAHGGKAARVTPFQSRNERRKSGRNR